VFFIVADFLLVVVQEPVAARHIVVQEPVAVRHRPVVAAQYMPAFVVEQQYNILAFRYFPVARRVALCIPAFVVALLYNTAAFPFRQAPLRIAEYRPASVVALLYNTALKVGP